MNDKAACGICCKCCGCSCRVCVVCGEKSNTMKPTDCDAFVCRDGECAQIHDECCDCTQHQRGVDIRGNFVSFDELSRDVEAAKAKGLLWAFMPETVEALLNWIATHKEQGAMA